MKYAVGIDLGTTNSVLAFAPLDAPDPAGAISVMQIEQLLDLGTLGNSPSLPSFSYLPGAHEVPAGAGRLPWHEAEPEFLCGEAAKRQGARVPARLIASAKSWLCHGGVDRASPILPWGAPDEVKRRSPVEVSALYLEHLRHAFFRSTGEDLAAQEVVLCVPASFDEVARSLTVEAARQAGLSRVSLVEEPQAAFYSFVAQHRASLAASLEGVRCALVVDVGGGTTDLTLIEVSPSETAEGVTLTRVAVGDHLMLGGDNMDHALARLLEPRLGGKLDAVEWAELCQTSRALKERLLSQEAPESLSVSLLGRGSGLLRGTRRAELSREETFALVVEGFFPETEANDLPKKARGGLRELGLPYVADPAIPRHIAAFLARHKDARPDALLLNGGALTPSAISARLVSLLGRWRGGEVRLLPSDSLDLAVAQGAAYYGLAKRGLGVRIGGGAARAYYVGLDAQGQKAALCVVPRRYDSLHEIEIAGREFALAVGTPVRFPLYASSADLTHQPGDVVPVTEELAELPPIETALKDSSGARELRVQLRAQVTEVGTLALSLVSEQAARRFRLEFNLRGSQPGAASEENTVPAARLREAKEVLEVIYGKKPREVTPRDITGLSKTLEKSLGRARDEWPTPLLRELFDALAQNLNQRNRSTEHHAAWLNLAGYCLRPGFGYPLDEERVQKLVPQFSQGPQFRQEKRSWVEWWIFWRRISGGLPAPTQESFFQSGLSLLRKTGQKAPEGVDEMMRFLASLERVPPPKKAALGEEILKRLERDGPSSHLLWCLGRVGSRVLFHGGAEWVIAPNTANDWVERLLSLSWKNGDDAAFAATLLSRKTGDRNRDLDPALAQRVVAQLRAQKASQAWIEMVSSVVTPSAQEQRRLFGESLPAGLRLVE
jgi:molecular chaperone DnaK (HSP70)